MTTILITLAGGLGLFIAGMNMMSRGIEKVAGTKLRAILAAFTRTKLLGILVGAFFTAVIQSSGATTVMVVSFVNSGLMDLTQAVSIVLGANIGTSVTALLVAIRLSAVAPLFVLLGAFMAEMVRNPKVRKIGEIVLGFGILFVGISTMSSAMSSLREVPAVVKVLSGFSNPAVGLLVDHARVARCPAYTWGMSVRAHGDALYVTRALPACALQPGDRIVGVSMYGEAEFHSIAELRQRFRASLVGAEPERSEAAVEPLRGAGLRTSDQ